MALKATIFKASLQVSDMDRNYYGEHQLTLARHPSETDERMMMRVLAFALNAHEHLEFGKGLSDTDEAHLWQKDLTGAIDRGEAEIAQRLQRAREEIALWRRYDYLIVNRDVKEAMEHLASIIQAERCRTGRLRLTLPDLEVSD